MTNKPTETTLRRAALVAGLAILIMALIAPFSELFVYPKLVNPVNAAETVGNITNNKMLFASAILGYLLTFTGDIVVSWAFYVLLKPVSGPLSLLTALFRLVFSVMALAALLNLVAVFRLLADHGYQALFGQPQLYAQVIFCLAAFKSGYHFGILLFGAHLVFLGCMVLKSGYIPNIMGILLVVCGLGYLTDALRPFLFPRMDPRLLIPTFFGELVFMFWLLIKGPRLKEGQNKYW